MLEENYHGAYDSEVDFARAIFDDCYSNAIPEDLQFYFYKENGSSLPLNSDPKLIKYVEVNLVIRSASEILKIPLSKISRPFNTANPSTNRDLYYRDILAASVWPRNIYK